MTDGSARLVRPWFFGASIVVFALLLPILAWSIWDSIELRRLDAAMAAIARAGQPIRLEPRTDLAGASADADRDYRAAAVLSSGRSAKQMTAAFASALAAAERDDRWPPELVAELSSWVDAYEEPASFADRAAELPFEGFSGGARYPYLTANLVTLLRVLGFRATIRALSGDTLGALQALYSEARLSRPLENNFAAARLAADVRTVLSHVRPPPDSLARLASAVAEMDQDDEITRELVQMRAAALERRAWNANLITRPLTTYAMNRQLDAYAELIRASRRAWPDRIDALATAGRSRTSLFGGKQPFGTGLFEAAADHLAVVRATRVVIAVEQYRRDHLEQLPSTLDDLLPAYLPAAPVDPFSGRAMRFLVDEHGYAAYSVGRNRQDDGGRDLGSWRGGATAWPRGSFGPDIGIRIERTR